MCCACGGGDTDDGPGPDACPEGEIKGCEGQCVSESLLGNNECNPELNCPEANNDGGDCEPAPPACVDTNGEATDFYGDGCGYYDDFPGACGFDDDEDFFANEMCCACGGGDTDDGPGPDVCPEGEIKGCEGQCCLLYTSDAADES